MMNCANCKTHNCYKTGQNCTRTTVEECKDLYTEEDKKIMRVAADVEGNHYMQITRLEETMIFAKEYGAKTIGLAFCIGLANEAKLIQMYLEKEFKIHSVCCKVCGVAKTNFDLTQIKAGTRETMCNPKMQANILAQQKTELNFTIGLCVGHDMLFNAASTVPTSCIITKDRLLGHNPVAAISTRYWRRKLGIQGEITLQDD